MRNCLAVALVLLGGAVVNAQQPIHRVRVVLALAAANHVGKNCGCPTGRTCECLTCEGAGTCACGSACACPTPRAVAAVRPVAAPVRVLRMVPAAQYYRGLPAASNCVGGR